MALTPLNRSKTTPPPPPKPKETDPAQAQLTQSNLTAVKNAYEVAKQYVDRNAADIKMGSDALGQAMEDWVPNDVNCANFVGGVLQAAGQIPSNLANAENDTLTNNLAGSGLYTQVDLKDAQPGDVVNLATSSGHIVLFAGWQDGKVGGTPLFIGSNNVNSDGSQRVTIGTQSAPIKAILHYTGPGSTPFSVANGATQSAGTGGAGSGGNTISGFGGGGGGGGGLSGVGGSSGVGQASYTPSSTPANTSTNYANPWLKDMFTAFLLDSPLSWDALVKALKEQNITIEQFLAANQGNKDVKEGQEIKKGASISLPPGTDVAALTEAMGGVDLSGGEAPLATAPAGTASVSLGSLSVGNGASLMV